MKNLNKSLIVILFLLFIGTANAYAVYGTCGSAHNHTFPYNVTSYGSYVQCSAGYSTNTGFPAQDSVLYYTCVGDTHSQSSACMTFRAAAPIAGVCGSAAKTYATSATAYSGAQCSSGSASNTAFPAQGATVTWTCSGTNGGAASGTCTAKRGKTGVCGPAAKTYATSATAYAGAQCSTGTASKTTFPAQGATVTWTCSGINGGAASGTCTAKRGKAGVCGPAATTYAYNVTAYSTAQCTAGTASSTLFPAQGASIAWTCFGINGGANSVVCTAIRNSAPIAGVCGPAATAYAYNATAYSGAQCSVGTASNTAFPPQGSSITWTCSGTNGGAASGVCTATRNSAPIAGVCGPAATTYAYNVTAYSTAQCSAGTASNTAFPPQGSSITWTCSGTNGGAASGTCTAIRNPAPLNGACGTANNVTYAYTITSYGTDTQCIAGTGTSSNTAFPAQNSIVTWTCSGLNGGSASPTCRAGRNSAPVDGVCGPAATTYAYNVTAYSTAQCSAGTASNTAFPEQGASITWICNGTNDGTNSGDCTAIRNLAPVNGVCGTADGKAYAVDVTDYGTDIQCATGISDNTVFPEKGKTITWKCVGENGGTDSGDCTASRLNTNSILLSNFHEPIELLPSDSSDAEQCLWCQSYEKTNLINGVNEIGTGKAGTLGFNFYYADKIDYKLKTLSVLVTTENTPTGGVQITVPRSVNSNSIVSFGEQLAPFIKADNSVSVLTVDETNQTIKIPYNGGTYNWFIKVVNTNSPADDSGWIAATGKEFNIPSHKWPTVLIQPVSAVTLFNNNQFCSTSTFSVTDPCYSTCWKGTGIPTNTDLTDTEKWKCSVCYNTDGSPVLCQDKAGTEFVWEDGGTTVFPISTDQTWWKYSGDNGRNAMNPIVKPKTSASRLTLTITGSGCSAGGGINTRINPLWKEK